MKNGDVWTIIFVSFGLYILLGLTLPSEFSVERYGSGKVLLDTESLEIPLGYKLSQSLFGIEGLDMSYLLQSTLPATENQWETILRAVVKNEQAEIIELKNVKIYKNDVLIESREFGSIHVSPGSSYIYKSPVLNLLGKEAQRNIVRLEILAEKVSGETYSQTYEYQYYTLTVCHFNSDCSIPNVICDIENVARFGTVVGEAYCVKPCLSHDDCYDGQICRAGRCGY